MEKDLVVKRGDIRVNRYWEEKWRKTRSSREEIYVWTGNGGEEEWRKTCHKEMRHTCGQVMEKRKSTGRLVIKRGDIRVDR